MNGDIQRGRAVKVLAGCLWMRSSSQPEVVITTGPKLNGVKLNCTFRRLRFEFWLGQEDASVAGSEDQPFPETKDYREVAKEYRSLTLASMGRDRTQDSGLRKRKTGRVRQLITSDIGSSDS